MDFHKRESMVPALVAQAPIVRFDLTITMLQAMNRMSWMRY